MNANPSPRIGWLRRGATLGIVLWALILGVASANGVTPTNTWINPYSTNSTLAGQPLPIGTSVAVFDPQGTQCGEFTVNITGWYGLMACYGDDGTTPEDEGAALHFKINDQAAIAEAITRNGTPVAPGTAVTWTQHGDLWQVNLNVPAALVYADPAAACGGNTPCYASLQTAITGVTAGGEVRYYGGAYNESVSLNTSATFNFVGSSAVTLSGSLAISAGTFNALAAQTLSLTGDFTQSGGTFGHNNGTVVFSGSGVQNLTANTATAFYNLTVNSGVTLVETVAADNVTVSGALTNGGVIRKTQSVSGTGAYTFGPSGR